MFENLISERTVLVFKDDAGASVSSFWTEGAVWCGRFDGGGEGMGW